MAAAPKLDIKYLTKAATAYAETKSIYAVIKSSPKFVAWSAIVTLIPLVLSIVLLFFYLVSGCMRCCCLRSTIKRPVYSKTSCRVACYSIQALSGACGLVGCAIIMAGCFRPYTTVAGVITVASALADNLNIINQPTIDAVDATVGNFFFDEATGKPFTPLRHAYTLDPAARKAYAAGVKLNTTLFVPILSDLNQTLIHTLAVLSPPLDAYNAHSAAPSLQFMGAFEQISADAPTFYRRLFNDSFYISGNLTPYAKVSPILFSNNYTRTNHSIYEKAFNYSLFVNASLLSSGLLKAFNASLAVFAGPLFTSMAEFNTYLNNTAPIPRSTLILPETPTRETLNNFMASFYSRNLSAEAHKVLETFTNGPTLYDLLGVICNESASGASAANQSLFCEIMACPTNATDPAGCLQQANTNIFNALFHLGGLDMQTLSTYLGEYLIGYGGLYFDGLKSFVADAGKLTVRELSNYLLNVKPCKGQNEAMAFLAQQLHTYDDTTGFCGYDLPREIPALESNSVLKGVYGVLRANPFVYMSLIFGAVLVIIPALFLGGALIGLCAQCTCCNCFSLCACYLLPAFVALLTTIFGILSMIANNGMCYNFFGVTLDFDAYLARNYPAVVPALRALQKIEHVALPAMLEDIVRTNVTAINLQELLAQAYGIVVLPKKELVINFSIPSYPHFAESLNLDPVEIVFRNLVTMLSVFVGMPVNITSQDPMYSYVADLSVLISELSLETVFAAPGSAAAKNASLFDALGAGSVMGFLETFVPDILRRLGTSSNNFVTTMLANMLSSQMGAILSKIGAFFGDDMLAPLRLFTNPDNYTYHPANDPSVGVYFNALMAADFYEQVLAPGRIETQFLGTGAHAYPLFDALVDSYIGANTDPAALPAFSYSNGSDDTIAFGLSVNAALLLEVLIVNKAPSTDIDAVKALFTTKNSFAPASFATTATTLKTVSAKHQSALLTAYNGGMTEALALYRLSTNTKFSGLPEASKPAYAKVLAAGYQGVYFAAVRSFTLAVYGPNATTVSAAVASDLFNKTVDIPASIDTSTQKLPTTNTMTTAKAFMQDHAQAADQFMNVSHMILDVGQYNMQSPHDPAAPSQPTYPLYDNINKYFIAGGSGVKPLLPEGYDKVLAPVLRLFTGVVGNGTTLLSPRILGTVMYSLQDLSCGGLLNMVGELGFGYFMLWVGSFLTLLAMISTWPLYAIARPGRCCTGSDRRARLNPLRSVRDRSGKNSADLSNGQSGFCDPVDDDKLMESVPSRMHDSRRW